MRPPGHLDELPPAGRKAWSARIADTYKSATAVTHHEESWSWRQSAANDSMYELRRIEWPAYPIRIDTCLGRDRTLELLDWHDDEGSQIGRALHQEEYAEWRIIRRRGRPRAIELTTELPEYWEVLAAHAPETTLALVAEFARTNAVNPNAVYGELDPFGDFVTPNERVTAFRNRMLAAEGSTRPPISPFNNGAQAMCCMVHRDNNLVALARLASSAAMPYLVRDSITRHERYPSGAEAIYGLEALAVAGRNSDPLLVEVLTRAATEARPIAFAEPIGVYIHDVQHHELAQPDGSEVPSEWLSYSRGNSASPGSDARSLYQRVTLELPADADFNLDDLIVTRSNQPFTRGGQFAELVELALYVRMGPPAGSTGLLPVDPFPSPLDCSEIIESWKAFIQAHP